MRVLIVDDEAPARRRLHRMLERVNGVEFAGEAIDGVDALHKIRGLKPDAVLLDIRMPGLDGMTLARTAGNLPPIIFTTAYDEFAVEAFEACAVDYLLKPVEQERLESALAKVRTRPGIGSIPLDDLLTRLGPAVGGALGTLAAAVPDASAPDHRISARSGDTVHMFDARQIARFHADSKYTVFTHEGREYLTEESLASIEDRLSHLDLFRCHRAELIALDRVRVLRNTDGAPHVELDDGQLARVSRRLLVGLKETLGAAGPIAPGVLV